MRINQDRIVLPRRLKAGDTIGVVAPAGPFDRDVFEKGISIIHGMGLATKTDTRIFASKSYLAGSDTVRADQFNAMVADPQVQAVISARGGFGSLRMLDNLDYKTIAAEAKPFIGFSDVTALHRAIFLRSGLVTFHGPMVTTLAVSDAASRVSWYKTLTEPVAPAIDLSAARVLKSGTAQGVMTGGNLTTLCHLTGTCIGAGFKGQILLLEDIGEAPYRIDRVLTQMQMAGLFDGVAGLVMGSFDACGSEEEIDALVLEKFQDYSIPIVSGAPIGHGRINHTVPLGLTVKLDTSRGRLQFVQATFEE